MATFVCDRCGKCCRSFGAFITIERQLGPRDFYCRYGITGEVFPVRVTPEFADAVDEAFGAREMQGKGASPPACGFLVADPSGNGSACAIYASRPRVCREFRCYRMLISRAGDGSFAGKVIGRQDIRTADPALRALWSAKIAPLPDNGGWNSAVLAILAAHEYRGDPVGD